MKRNPEIITTDLDNEVVLLNPRTQAMFTLNATGRAVWLGLEETDAEGLAERLEAQFEVTRDVALNDVQGLLVSLREAGLVHD